MDSNVRAGSSPARGTNLANTMILGKHTNSLNNWVLSGNKRGPVVGEGATELMWSDRYAYFVDQVSKDGKQCVLERAKAIPEFVGMTDSQSYRYERDPKSTTTVLRFRYNSWWKKQYDEDNNVVYSKINISFGHMNEYYDFSF